MTGRIFSNHSPASPKNCPPSCAERIVAMTGKEHASLHVRTRLNGLLPLIEPEFDHIGTLILRPGGIESVRERCNQSSLLHSLGLWCKKKNRSGPYKNESGETDLNLCGSPRTMKITRYTMEPTSGPLRGTAGRVFLNCCS